MLGWASSQFEKLSQTVAPPPTDGNSRFVYAVQKGDEDGAMACVSEMDDVARTKLNPTRGSYAIHLACQQCMDRLIRYLLQQPGVDLTYMDSAGNTPLHYACLSTDTLRTLPTVKLLVTELGASVVAKNSLGQTPYDVATVNSVRQFLLPLQLQQETQAAIDNGGVGLPPGIDMGGLRIRNPVAPPPPIRPAPMSSPAPTHSMLQQQDGGVAPTSGGYALSGSSSAHTAVMKGFRKPDGFHSSSSDANLQKKYGHYQSSQYANIAPPPASGGAPIASAFAGGGGNNPFAGGAAANPYSGRANSRYVAYDAVSNTTSPMPMAMPNQRTMSAPNTGTANYGVFQPLDDNKPQQQQQHNQPWRRLSHPKRSSSNHRNKENNMPADGRKLPIQHRDDSTITMKRMEPRRGKNLQLP
ncbi:Ankyrin Repeat [Seminavis robusta]|uniref:Ankyrin Repeat n=1 Tax=Seminavis robusta TaxID=568900 RepID=A0A9N8F051_9STRA|nr:Ankyrin Repeat [Seminavis robusta]|eukprot:Sro2173_g317570.1 Ankyrin Repeat (412) ;mRNA; r:1323-2558